MLDLEGIKNQIRFFDCFDAAVIAYKMMADGEASSFYDAIKKQKRIPLINSIPSSNVLLANHVLKTASSRQALMMLIREEEDFIKFDEIQNKDAYIQVRDKIFKNDPSLSHAECNKVLKQICNAIAHGDILNSLDFDEYEKMINQIYSYGRSLNANRPELSKMYYDGHIASSRLKFNYETFFEILPDGTRVKRPKPVKKQLTLNHDDISKIVYLVSDYTDTTPAAFYINKDRNIDVLDLTKTDFDESRSTYVLDDIQRECLFDLKNEYYNKCIKTMDKDLSERVSISMAISKIMLGDKFKYLKVRELVDVGGTISKGLQQTKRSPYEITNSLGELYAEKLNNGKIFKFDETGTEVVSKDFNLSIRSVLNTDIDNIYKNFLIVEVSNMLQIVEQNNLKLKVCSNPEVSEMITEICDKDTPTDKEKIKILDNIRDAFIHGTYINDIEDKINIYDQVSRTEKTLEYKFTVYNSDLENIKNSCITALKERKAELEAAISSPTPPAEKERAL